MVQALEEDLDWRDKHARLVVRTNEWVDAGRDGSFLLRGSDLRSAEEWLGQAASHTRTPPTIQQTEYILVSRKAAARRQRTWLGALSVGLVISLSLAAVAYVQRQQAIHQRDTAVSGQLVSQSELMGDTNPVLSKLLSIAAWRLDPSASARYAMLAAATRPGIAILSSNTGALAASSAAFSPDGKILASGSAADGTVRLWDVATHRQTGAPLTGTGTVRSVAFSPDGKTLASGGEDGSIRLWDVATRQQSGNTLAGGTGEVFSVAFSPDGKALASASEDGVWLWNVASGQIGPLSGHLGEVLSVAFSPDGKTLATGSADDTVRLWNVATRQQIGQPLTGDTEPVLSVAFSPTARPWPPAVLTTPSGCGTWPPTSRSGSP